MTHLLCVDWAPVDHSLVCLAQDRVERLLDVEVHKRIAQSETYGQFHTLERVLSVGGLFKKVRAHRHRLTQPLGVRVLAENFYRKRDAENGLASE